MLQFQLKEAIIEHDNSTSWLRPSLLYAVRHGSQAYGTNTSTSDLDVKGIVIPPARYYTGYLDKGFQQITHSAPDYVFYEMRRFIELAVGCNPNIIEMLYVESSDHLFVHRFMHRILENRDMFLSRLARDTFFGYAHNQLKRIKNHRAWLLNPPTKKPERSDYSLPELSVINPDQIKAAEHLNSKGFSYDTNFQDIIYKEKQYRQASQHWDQYVNWQNTRNPVRHALEVKYGYDTKHAMHLVRLIRMCREILEFGQVHVKRMDAEEILAVRNGAWTYDQLIEWSDNHRSAIDAMVITSRLPALPPSDKINELCQDVISDMLGL